MNLPAYYRLMRFHKPLGIVLLWVPTAWSLWFANQGIPPWTLFLYFFLGTVCMRAAGCVINDIADRHIDKHVKRTQLRPLTHGEISLIQAFSLLLLLLFTAYLIVSQLPARCFYEALWALLITLIYPFCKRFFQAPQLALSIAFSMGIPMAYTASGIACDPSTLLLFILNANWIVMYDTQYAMVDREDDLLIGVRSTAVLFGQYDRLIIGLLQIFMHGLWLFLVVNYPVSLFFYGCWLMGLMILAYQQYLIGLRQPTAYFKAFNSNGWYGFIMWLGLMITL